jgi:hypothetical protein
MFSAVPQRLPRLSPSLRVSCTNPCTNTGHRPVLLSMSKLSAIFTGRASTRLVPPLRDELFGRSVSLSPQHGNRGHVGVGKLDANELSNALHTLGKPYRDVVVVQRHVVHVDAVEQLRPPNLASMHECVQQRQSPEIKGRRRWWGLFSGRKVPYTRHLRAPQRDGRPQAISPEEDGPKFVREDPPEPLMTRQAHQVRDVRCPPDEILRVRPENLSGEHPIRSGAVLESCPDIFGVVSFIWGWQSKARCPVPFLPSPEVLLGTPHASGFRERAGKNGAARPRIADNEVRTTRIGHVQTLPSP